MKQERKYKKEKICHWHRPCAAPHDRIHYGFRLLKQPNYNPMAYIMIILTFEKLLKQYVQKNERINMVF